MQRKTQQIDLPVAAIGQGRFLKVHQYGDYVEGVTERAYIQASLHADEIPGLLVNHHLVKLLDKAAAENKIRKCVLIVPFANPIGLSQILLGSHLGRFNLDTGTNFNRDWPDYTNMIAERIAQKLRVDDADHNVRLIRSELLRALEEDSSRKEESVLKKTLFKLASTSDIVLDLHCDTEAVMHMYTHTRLWPQMMDLATELNSECHIISEVSGGNPFDEACSCPWACLADRFPEHPIPMACQSVTVELRGEVQVYDHLAEKDALGIYRFLQNRGYIDKEPDWVPSTISIPTAVPLAGVDMIEASAPGVVAWKVGIGAIVCAGQLLGEIVNIEDPDAERIPITTSTAGLVFGMRCHKLVRPGQIVIKVAGDVPLSWRTGNLLTAK